tara:strand:+ start:3425 stop:3706 length:282 start_codon:yes stop_codon:yes gene_type:complete
VGRFIVSVPANTACASGEGRELRDSRGEERCCTCGELRDSRGEERCCTRGERRELRDSRGEERRRACGEFREGRVERGGASLRLFIYILLLSI